MRFHGSSNIVRWFEDDSFFICFTKLVTIVNGGTALEQSQVNCDETEQIGVEIQKSLDDVEFKIINIKRGEKAKTIACLQSAVKIGDELDALKAKFSVFWRRK